MTPKKLHKADAHAPRGYWEFLPLWDLLSELGDFDAGASWWDHDFQQKAEKKAADPAYRQKATELWRNDCDIPFEQITEATSEQKALYAFIKQKINNPFEPFDVTKYPRPPGYREFLNIQEALLKACRELEHQ